MSTIDKEIINHTECEKKNILCPKCNSILPCDSVFCQVCGEKLSENSNDCKNAEKLLCEFKINEINGSCPVLIENANLYCSIDREQYYLRCEFKSLSDKIISALMIDVFCFDVWGNELEPVKGAQILDLSANRDEKFGFFKKIYMIDVNTRKVKIRLKQILFEDNDIEECTGEEIHIPDVIPLEEYFDAPELRQQYISETSEKSSVVPVQLGHFWQCACGEINSEYEETCIQCNTEKKIVFESLDEKFLSEKYTEYLEQKRTLEEQYNKILERRNLAEQIRQAEIKKERMAEIQEARNRAIQNRIATIKAEDKRKKKINTITFISVAVIITALISFFSIKAMCDDAYRGELRNFVTDTMDEKFTNVYADVISIKPKYFVYSYNTTRYGTKIGSGELWDVVCECATVENKTIWVSFFYQYYPEGNYSQNEEDFKPLTYSRESPKRLVGYVDKARQVSDNLEEIIGDVFVLNVKNTSNEE